uniref:Tetratricopeptide repeat domain-containing protein n=1 Tax=Chloropicon primus TaxID=1764295 RepID=A0A7S2WYR2_9CHLO|mmetsp:Transcript_3371/g.9417  ORF Transcript_3371/g.9417 Transcript_3371/m.9417 type:complete len:292 (+) Transcript_3371:150-1025(+)
MTDGSEVNGSDAKTRDLEWLKDCIQEGEVEPGQVLRREGRLKDCDKLFEDGMLDEGAEDGEGLGEADLAFESESEEDYGLDDFELEEGTDAEERKQHLRGQLVYLVREFMKRDPGYLRKPLSALNKEAAQFQKGGDDMSAVAAYSKLFAKVTKNRLTHPELYVTHCNRASAYLNLGLHEEALWDSMKCMQLAEKALNRNVELASQIFVKAHAKKGFALLGMERYRAASAVFDKGLKMDPFSKDMKRGLEEAQRMILEDLLSGKSQRVKALPSNRDYHAQKITMQPYSAPQS